MLRNENLNVKLQVTGIALKNLPGVKFDDQWQSYSKTIRGVALVVILLRAGLGLDPAALKRLSGKTCRKVSYSPNKVLSTLIQLLPSVLSCVVLGHIWQFLWTKSSILGTQSPKHLREKGLQTGSFF